MSANNQFSSVLFDLWADLQQPDVLWQIGVLAGCLALAWLVDHFMRGRHVGESTAAWQLGRRGVKRLAFPLTALVLVVLARVVLRQ